MSKIKKAVVGGLKGAAMGFVTGGPVGALAGGAAGAAGGLLAPSGKSKASNTLMTQGGSLEPDPIQLHNVYKDTAISNKAEYGQSLDGISASSTLSTQGGTSAANTLLPQASSSGADLSRRMNIRKKVIGMRLR